MRTIALLALSASILVSHSAIAGPGQLDQSFGTGGFVTLGFDQTVPVRTRATARQADGKVVVAGDISETFQGQPVDRIVFSRINGDGTLDTTYGQDGWKVMNTLEQPYMSCSPVAITVSPDGRSIAVAVCNGLVTLVRMTQAGESDPSFGAAGVQVDWDSAGQIPRAIAADPLGASYAVAGSLPDPVGVLPVKAFVTRYTLGGTRDTMFGSGGTTSSGFDGAAEANAVTYDYNHRILIAGYGAYVGGSKDMLVARFTADGQVDAASFGSMGSLRTDHTGRDDIAYSITLDWSHRILIGGRAGDVFADQPQGVFYLWRVTSYGGWDSTFGSGGTITADVPVVVDHDADSEIRSLAFDMSYGHILAGGTARLRAGGDPSLALARFDENGHPFLPFGNNGTRAAPVTADADELLDAYFEDFGRILAIGKRGPGAGEQVLVAKFFAMPGFLDAAFGAGGTATYASLLGSNNTLRDIALQPDGRILAIGDAAWHTHVARWNPDGTLDATFGSGGVVAMMPYGQLTESAGAIAVQLDGRILVASSPGIVSRLNPDGSRDYSWGGTGEVHGNAGSDTRSMAVGADGRVVTASSEWSGLGQRIVLTRFNSYGQVDGSLGMYGFAMLNRFGVSEEFPQSLRVLPDGSMFVAGYSRLHSNAYEMVVYRVRSSGALETSWGSGGFAVVNLPGGNAIANDVWLQPDGRVLLAGGCRVGTGPAQSCFARLTPAGTLDNTFGNGGIVLFPVGVDDRAITAQMLPNGRILAGVNANGIAAIGLYADGSADSTFNGSGFNVTSISGEAAGAIATFDGGLLVGGTTTVNGRSRWVVARFEAGPADATRPETTLTSAPAGTVIAPSATLTFISSEPGGSFECSLDGAAFAGCNSPLSLTGLAEGAHAFQVRARDAAGNVDATPATAGWTVDLGPETTIASGPSAVTASSNATFVFSADEAVSRFECRRDSQPYGPCTSPHSYSGNSSGNHTFSVRAVSLGGIVDATPATWSWTVDQTPPSTTITSAPVNNTTATTATFTFTSSEPGSTFMCRLEALPWAACTSPATYSGLTRTTHTFSVLARDPAGNPDTTPATYTWRIR